MADATKTIEIKVETKSAQASLNAAKSAMADARAETEAYREAVKLWGVNSKEAIQAQLKANQTTEKAKQSMAAARAASLEAASALTRYGASADASDTKVKKLSGEIQKLDRELLKQTTSAAKLERETRQYTQSLLEAEKAAGKAASGTEKTTSGLSGVSSILSSGVAKWGLYGAAVAGAGAALVEAGQKSVQLGAARSALEKYTASTGGADAAVEKLRAATRGLVSDYELTVSMNKAVTSGVVKTADEYAVLAEAAMKLGAAHGRDLAGSVTEVTEALATGSTEVLNNIGIILKAEQSYELYAQKIGKSVDALTDQEKSQAFAVIGMQKVIETADRLNVKIDGVATTTAAMAAKWSNFVDTASEFAAAGAGYVITGLGMMRDAMVDAAMAAVGLETQIGGVTTSAADLAKKVQEQALQEVDAMSQLIDVAKELDYDLADVDVTKPIQELARLQGIQERDKKRAEELSKRVKANADSATASLAKERQERAKRNQQQSAKAAAAAAKDDREVQQLLSGAYSEGPSSAAAHAELMASYKAEEDARTEILLRAAQQRVDVASRELEAVNIESDAYLSAVDKKARAELDLLDIQKQRTDDSIELARIQTEREKVELDRRVIHAKVAADRERKIQMQREATIMRVGETTSDVLSATAATALEAAGTEEKAAARAIAAQMKSMRNQMIATAVKESVLAIASAASYNFPAAAAHGVAAGEAAAAAVVIGSLGAIAGAAAGPDKPKEAKAKEKESTQNRAQDRAGHAEASEVPVSQDPTLRGVRSVPEEVRPVQIVLQNPQFIGSDEEQAGRLLKRALARAEGLR